MSDAATTETANPPHTPAQLKAYAKCKPIVDEFTRILSEDLVRAQVLNSKQYKESQKLAQSLAVTLAEKQNAFNEKPSGQGLEALQIAKENFDKAIEEMKEQGKFKKAFGSLMTDIVRDIEMSGLTVNGEKHLGIEVQFCRQVVFDHYDRESVAAYQRFQAEEAAKAKAAVAPVVDTTPAHGLPAKPEASKELTR